MIQANELRIGNWVEWKDNKQRFDLTIGLIVKPEIWIHISEGDIIPIPLTPEILEKCGFKGIGSDFEINEVHIYSGHHEFWYWNDKVEVKLTSLHQLQNLYFALTGEELNVQL